MNKRLFIFVIILMGISLAGIILLQLFWINNAISIREEHFNKTVNSALRETAEKLESHENILLLGDRFTSSYSYDVKSDEDSEYIVSVWTEDGDESEIIEYKHEIRIDSIKNTIARVKAEVEIDSLSRSPVSPSVLDRSSTLRC